VPKREIPEFEEQSCTHETDKEMPKRTDFFDLKRCRYCNTPTPAKFLRGGLCTTCEKEISRDPRR